jgi:aminopeptidase N
MGRLLAVSQWASKKKAAAVEKLEERLNQDPFFAVREAAASELGKLRDDAAFAALQGSLDQEDARVRSAVVSALTQTYSEKAYNVVKRVADQETNPRIRGRAIRALGKYAKPELRGYLLRLLQRDSYEHSLADAAIQAMRSHDDPYYVDPLLRTLKADEAKFTSRGFGSALGVLGRLARNDENTERVRVFLMEQVDHLKRSVARAAMGALGTLGDAKALPLLESYAADPDSEEGRAAQRAMEQLRKEAPASVPQEVQTLRTEVRDLRSQLRQVNADIKVLREQMRERLKSTAPGQAAEEKK